VWGNGSTAESITVTAPGTYTVTVGTGFGHTIPLSYTVEMATADAFDIVRTPVLCAGDSTGTIEVVNLNTNEIVFQESALPAGNVVFPLTIIEGCVIQQEVWINEPLPFVLMVDSIKPACFELNNGSAVVQGIDGTAPYTGFNEFGTLALIDLSAGVYSDTIMDSHGCPSTYSFTIAEIPQALIEVTSPHWVCPGESVVFEATVFGIGDNYFWDVAGPGTSLSAGNYLAAVVDSNLCVTTVELVIEEISSPTIDATIASESVLGLGSINLDVVGNYPPYTATWQSGFVGLNYADLAQGNYNVSISDSIGCTLDTLFTVLFNFVEEEVSHTEFIIDWKTGQLKYTGNDRLFEVEVFDSIGQLLVSESSLGSNEIIQLNVSPQMIFISSSKGNSRTKILLK
jgi:hypothetical protein